MPDHEESRLTYCGWRSSHHGKDILLFPLHQIGMQAKVSLLTGAGSLHANTIAVLRDSHDLRWLFDHVATANQQHLGGYLS